MKKNTNYKKNTVITEAINDLRAAESKVEHELLKERLMIDVSTRGDAAVSEHMRTQELESEKKTMLSPEHLRYLAR